MSTAGSKRKARPATPEPTTARETAFRRTFEVVVTYLVLGFIWIATSDRLLAAFTSDPRYLTELQSYKGWFFVTATGLILFGLIYPMLLNVLTAQRTAELSEHRFRALFESPLMGMVFCHWDGTFIQANPAFAEMAEVHPDEFRTHSIDWSALLERRSVILSVQALSELKQRGWCEPVEDVLLTRSGAKIPVLVGATVLSREELVAFVLDIRQQVEAQAALQRLSEELETRVRDRTRDLSAANESLEAYATTISHDLRAPLRAIDGFAAILDEHQTGFDEDSKHALDRIHVATSRMKALIESLLKLGQVDQSKVVPEHLDLTGMVREIAHQLTEVDPARRVDWRIQPDATAFTDPNLAGLVLRNLLENAWKYSSKQSAPIIEFGRLGNEFFVRDNGAGFDDAYGDQLYEAFRRYHTESEFPGSGIGLAIVKRALAKLGGSVRAESKPGHGATFWFTLGPSSPAFIRDAMQR